MRKKQIYFIIFGLIILLSAFLRFHKLTYRDFWYDEAFTGVVIKWNWPQMMNGLIRDVHPPLYYILVKPWAALFHYSAFGIRSFSAIFGIATVIMAFLLVKKIFKSWPLSLIASLVVAIAPFNLEYSQEARMYSLFGFLILTAVYFFYSSFYAHKWRNTILWAIFFGLAVNTHYLSFFTAPLFYLAFVFLHKPLQNSAKSLKKILFRLLPDKYFFTSVGIIILSLMPWFKVLLKHLNKHQLGWIPAGHLSDLPDTIQIFFFGSPPGMGGVPEPTPFKYLFTPYSIGLFIYSLVLLLTVIYFYKKKAAKQKIGLFLIFSFGLPLILIFASYFKVFLYVSRYFAPAAIIMQILLVLLLYKTLGKKLTFAFVLIYILLIFNLNPPLPEHKYQLLSQFLEQNNQENSRVYALDPFAFTILRYYLGTEKVSLYNKNNPAEDFSGWVSVGNEKRVIDLEKILADQNSVIFGKIEKAENKMEKLGEVNGEEIYKVKKP